MSWDIAESDWAKVKGKIKSRWGKISDAHLAIIAGKRENLSTRLQEVYSITGEEADEQIKSFEAHTKDLRPKAES